MTPQNRQKSNAKKNLLQSFVGAKEQRPTMLIINQSFWEFKRVYFPVQKKSQRYGILIILANRNVLGFLPFFYAEEAYRLITFFEFS